MSAAPVSTVPALAHRAGPLMHSSSTASPWLQRWLHLLPAGGRVLDVACGRGRHLRWLAGRGYRLTGIDRDASALAESVDLSADGAAELITADIENGPWPCAGRVFDALLVFNYLWRPLWPQLLASLAPGGVLVVETFAAGNETVGKPSRPDFLLQPGELINRCQGLHIVAYEDGFLEAPARFVQRVVAVRPALAAGPTSPPPRHPLAAAGPA